LTVPTLVVTLGELGCVVHSAGKTRRHPAHPATPLDTTGASDAFTATLAAYLTAGTSGGKLFKPLALLPHGPLVGPAATNPCPHVPCWRR